MLILHGQILEQGSCHFGYQIRCGVPKLSQSELGLTKRTSPSAKEDATLGWENLVPTAIFGIYKENSSLFVTIPIAPFSEIHALTLSHSHLGSKDRVIILLSTPVGGFGELSQLVSTCPNSEWFVPIWEGCKLVYS